jgi:hypothetical protein
MDVTLEFFEQLVALAVDPLDHQRESALRDLIGECGRGGTHRRCAREKHERFPV